MEELDIQARRAVISDLVTRYLNLTKEKPLRHVLDSRMAEIYLKLANDLDPEWTKFCLDMDEALKMVKLPFPDVEALIPEEEE